MIPKKRKSSRGDDSLSTSSTSVSLHNSTPSHQTRITYGPLMQTDSVTESSNSVQANPPSDSDEEDENVLPSDEEILPVIQPYVPPQADDLMSTMTIVPVVRRKSQDMAIVPGIQLHFWGFPENKAQRYGIEDTDRDVYSVIPVANMDWNQEGSEFVSAMFQPFDVEGEGGGPEPNVSESQQFELTEGVFDETNRDQGGILILDNDLGEANRENQSVVRSILDDEQVSDLADKMMASIRDIMESEGSGIQEIFQKEGSIDESETEVPPGTEDNEGNEDIYDKIFAGQNDMDPEQKFLKEVNAFIDEQAQKPNKCRCKAIGKDGKPLNKPCICKKGKRSSSILPDDISTPVIEEIPAAEEEAIEGEQEIVEETPQESPETAEVESLVTGEELSEPEVLLQEGEEEIEEPTEKEEEEEEPTEELQDTGEPIVELGEEEEPPAAEASDEIPDTGGEEVEAEEPLEAGDEIAEPEEPQEITEEISDTGEEAAQPEEGEEFTVADEPTENEEEEGEDEGQQCDSCESPCAAEEDVEQMESPGDEEEGVEGEEAIEPEEPLEVEEEEQPETGEEAIEPEETDGEPPEESEELPETFEVEIEQESPGEGEEGGDEELLAESVEDEVPDYGEEAAEPEEPLEVEKEELSETGEEVVEAEELPDETETTDDGIPEKLEKAAPLSPSRELIEELSKCACCCMKLLLAQGMPVEPKIPAPEDLPCLAAKIAKESDIVPEDEITVEDEIPDVETVEQSEEIPSASDLVESEDIMEPTDDIPDSGEEMVSEIETVPDVEEVPVSEGVSDLTSETGECSELEEIESPEGGYDSVVEQEDAPVESDADELAVSEAAESSGEAELDEVPVTEEAPDFEELESDEVPESGEDEAPASEDVTASEEVLLDEGADVQDAEALEEFPVSDEIEPEEAVDEAPTSEDVPESDEIEAEQDIDEAPASEEAPDSGETEVDEVEAPPDSEDSQLDQDAEDSEDTREVIECGAEETEVEDIAPEISEPVITEEDVDIGDVAPEQEIDTSEMVEGEVQADDLKSEGEEEAPQEASVGEEEQEDVSMGEEEQVEETAVTTDGEPGEDEVGEEIVLTDVMRDQPSSSSVADEEGEIVRRELSDLVTVVLSLEEGIESGKYTRDQFPGAGDQCRPKLPGLPHSDKSVIEKEISSLIDKVFRPTTLDKDQQIIPLTDEQFIVREISILIDKSIASVEGVSLDIFKPLELVPVGPPTGMIIDINLVVKKRRHLQRKKIYEHFEFQEQKDVIEEEPEGPVGDQQLAEETPQEEGEPAEPPTEEVGPTEAMEGKPCPEPQEMPEETSNEKYRMKKFLAEFDIEMAPIKDRIRDIQKQVVGLGIPEFDRIIVMEPAFFRDPPAEMPFEMPCKPCKKRPQPNKKNKRPFPPCCTQQTACPQAAAMNAVSTCCDQSPPKYEPASCSCSRAAKLEKAPVPRKQPGTPRPTKCLCSSPKNGCGQK